MLLYAMDSSLLRESSGNIIPYGQQLMKGV